MTSPEPARWPVRLAFPFPDKLISLNDRGHWSQRASRTATWRQMAHIQGLNAKRNLRLEVPFSGVVVTCTFYGARQKDASNLTPTSKAVVDGLTAAGWWDDDDDSRVSQHEPVVVRSGFPAGLGQMCCVQVDPR